MYTRGFIIDMIEIEITDDMLSSATQKAEEMGKLNNSILKGKGNIAGFLGEQVALKVLGGEWSNTFDYDIVVGDIKVDVKTKQTTAKPKPFYECSVAKYNTKQRCDAYAFVRVLKDFSKGWYLGAMKKEDYLSKATPLKRGDVDPSNNFTVRADCYNLPISDLGELLQ
tara:strand:+ start:21 stop:524 length:504 start_codon:yes stop_codon:yes gene_type:complete